MILSIKLIINYVKFCYRSFLFFENVKKVIPLKIVIRSGQHLKYKKQTLYSCQCDFGQQLLHATSLTSGNGSFYLLSTFRQLLNKVKRICDLFNTNLWVFFLPFVMVNFFERQRVNIESKHERAFKTLWQILWIKL